VTAFTSFVVFAEMRTGSNFLEANLNAIEGVTCHGEAFNPFFIGGEGKVELFGIDMAGRNSDPSGFLQAMRRQTPGLSGFRYFSSHDPRVFDLVMADRTCAKIVLTRNQLESFISWKIAKESDQWWLANTKHLQTVRPTFSLDEFNARNDTLNQFQAKLTRALQTLGQTAYYIDYDDIRDLDVLNGLAAFLGVAARIDGLNFRFKKQNPEAIVEKVANPLEMQKQLATVDWFNLHHVPNYEPRRLPAVAQYMASTGVDLLYMPIKCGPDHRIKKWLQSYGPMLESFDRQTLRHWKSAHPGQRSFAVLRHPLERAYTAWCDLIAKEWMPELRPYLKRVHKFALPPKGKPFGDVEEFRTGFMVFLELIKHIQAGRTELRVMPQIASLGATIQGFALLQSPDVLIHEDKLAEGLDYLCADLGIAAKPIPETADNRPYALSDIYAPDMEAAAREAYWRDYAGFGFDNWLKA
jgi:hypothetical protein